MWVRALFMVAIAAGLAACGNQTSNAVSAPFEAEVYLRDFNEDCRKVPCWQPTQFEARLVERESVSLEERGPDEEGGPQVGWPMDGDKVRVECLAKGGQYANENGQLINDWYGILVPADKLEPKAKDDPRLIEIEGGYRAYVGISWLRGGEGKQLPSC